MSLSACSKQLLIKALRSVLLLRNKTKKVKYMLRSFKKKEIHGVQPLSHKANLR